MNWYHRLLDWKSIPSHSWSLIGRCKFCNSSDISPYNLFLFKVLCKFLKWWGELNFGSDVCIPFRVHPSLRVLYQCRIFIYTQWCSICIFWMVFWLSIVAYQPSIPHHQWQQEEHSKRQHFLCVSLACSAVLPPSSIWIVQCSCT